MVAGGGASVIYAWVSVGCAHDSYCIPWNHDLNAERKSTLWPVKVIVYIYTTVWKYTMQFWSSCNFSEFKNSFLRWLSLMLEQEEMIHEIFMNRCNFFWFWLFISLTLFFTQQFSMKMSLNLNFSMQWHHLWPWRSHWAGQLWRVLWCPQWAADLWVCQDPPVPHDPVPAPRWWELSWNYDRCSFVWFLCMDKIWIQKVRFWIRMFMTDRVWMKWFMINCAW